jgi:hypothetical protein
MCSHYNPSLFKLKVSSPNLSIVVCTETLSGGDEEPEEDDIMHKSGLGRRALIGNFSSSHLPVQPQEISMTVSCKCVGVSVPLSRVVIEHPEHCRRANRSVRRAFSHRKRLKSRDKR